MSNDKTVREGITNATVREDFAERTVREYEPGATVREHEDVTVREASDSAGETQREQASAQKSQSVGRLLSFRQFKIEKQIPSGGEADIYLTETNEIIKLYRFGINPKRDVIENILRLSQQHPAHLVNMREFGFDDASQRWYVVMEYVPCGSLKEYFAAGKISTDVAFKILKELSEAVRVLHENNIIHQDIKPANVLIRTRNPLDLVLSDFGISSAVDVEASKHLTGRGKGTALYNTPEAFSGIVGKFTDWWGVGMMLLEGLAGSHPFDGLEAHVITFRLTTNDIEIPQSIPDEWQLLLKGLLTRNPDNRWGYEQVSRWLAGDRDIPVTEAVAAEVEKDEGIEKPYKFNDEKYYSLSKLAAAFVKDEASWNRAVEHMGRGMVSKWLENNEMNDEAIDVENQLAKAGKYVDVAVSCFVADHTERHPFIFKSCLITPNNIIACFGKWMKNEAIELEEKIAQAVWNGSLGVSYKKFVEITNYRDETLGMLFDVLKGKDKRQSWELLSAIKNKEFYCWPDNIDVNSRNAMSHCLKALKQMNCAPFLNTDVKTLEDSGILTEEIRGVKPKEYKKIFENILGIELSIPTSRENVYFNLIKHNAPLAVLEFAYVAINDKVDGTNTESTTPLMYSVACGNKTAYDFFINKGANIHCKDKEGNTLLHIAALREQADYIKPLVQLGLNLNEQNNKGETPLAKAVEQSNVEAAKTLLELGADPNTKLNGRSLWHCVSRQNLKPKKSPDKQEDSDKCDIEIAIQIVDEDKYDNESENHKTDDMPKEQSNNEEIRDLLKQYNATLTPTEKKEEQDERGSIIAFVIGFVVALVFYIILHSILISVLLFLIGVIVEYRILSKKFDR